MKAAIANKPRRRSRALKTAAAIVGCTALAGATVVAAGGVDAVKQWFATVELVHPDGTTQKVEMRDDGFVQLDDDHAIVLTPDNMEDLRGKEIQLLIAPEDAHAFESNEGESGGVSASPAANESNADFGIVLDGFE